MAARTLLKPVDQLNMPYQPPKLGATTGKGVRISAQKSPVTGLWTIRVDTETDADLISVAPTELAALHQLVARIEEQERRHQADTSDQADEEETNR